MSTLPADRPNLVPEVAAASDETLVSALVVLTHQIERSEDAARRRVERDIVRAEILRRMGA